MRGKDRVVAFIMDWLYFIIAAAALMLIAALLPSLTSSKYALDIRYRSDHKEKSTSNAEYESDKSSILPFIPEASETVHSYDGFEYRAVFRTNELPQQQSRAIRAASAIGNPILSTGASLRYRGSAAGLRSASAIGKGNAALKLDGFVAPFLFALIFFVMLYTAGRFSKHKHGATRLLIAVFTLWFLYSMTLGTAALFTANSFVNDIIVRFGIDLNPLPIMLLDAPFRIAILGGLYLVIVFAIRKGKADKLKITDEITDDKKSVISGVE